MNPVVFHNNKVRAWYKRVERYIKKHAFANESFIIQPKLIRLEKVLLSTQTSYKFDFYQVQGADRDLEIKLNRNNVFFMIAMGIGLTKQDATTSPAQYANFPIFSNPDPNFFEGENAGGDKEHHALEAVYNGLITLKTKPVDRINDLATEFFRFVPERNYQKLVAPQVQDEYPQSGPSLEEKGLIPLEPISVLDGAKNNEAILSLGSGDYTLIEGTVDSTDTAVTTRNVLVLRFWGFEVIDAAGKLSDQALREAV